MLSPAPLIETSGREVILDVNFVEEMKLLCQFWPGRVVCILRRGADQIAHGVRYSPRRLGFHLVVLDPDAPLPELLIEEAALVYCAADDLRALRLPDQMRGRPTRLVFTLEGPPRQRLSKVLSDRQRPVVARLRTALGLLRYEHALRAALRAADGVHFNGFPAQQAYRRLNRASLMYLDNRIRTPMLARAADQQVRADLLRTGAPLRLIHMGPFEMASGVLDLLQAAYLLKLRGVAFTLELFGNGSLDGRLRDGIAALGMDDRVTLAGNPGFGAALAPHLRKGADLLLSARRADDPDPVYLEAMGCGVPVLGYANGMWRRLHAESGGGWLCRSGSVAALSSTLALLDTDREAIIRASSRALSYARGHTFESVFSRRMSHLREIARLD
ncbi:MAG: glycosyltransferase [Pararhodobacter sp.]|nr:glycosyltransferase [Pararhodobacter sp.]